ncbi:hypothetical protein [Emergencia sp. 1XD21-10]|uniref:hypothetical protein n=1 Tax=Emergencia sp. 1XD21-10 TaxID=2304569 RepID=UPI00137B2C2F|nr:hypothetical protein [Emergencia sp. 1XD21-10]NCE98194.1 hypothetical protein [Emergencia sp. 1XD21-10]
MEVALHIIEKAAMIMLIGSLGIFPFLVPRNLKFTGYIMPVFSISVLVLLAGLYIKECTAYAGTDYCKNSVALFFEIIKEKPYFGLLFVFMAVLVYGTMRLLAYICDRKFDRWIKIMTAISMALVAFVPIVAGGLLCTWK